MAMTAKVFWPLSVVAILTGAALNWALVAHVQHKREVDAYNAKIKCEADEVFERSPFALCLQKVANRAGVSFVLSQSNAEQAVFRSNDGINFSVLGPKFMALELKNDDGIELQSFVFVDGKFGGYARTATEDMIWRGVWNCRDTQGYSGNPDRCSQLATPDKQ